MKPIDPLTMQIPSIPFPRQSSQDPAAYVKSMKVQPGAPLSGEADLLPSDVVNRSEKDLIGLMDAPARAALSESGLVCWYEGGGMSRLTYRAHRLIAV